MTSYLKRWRCWKIQRPAFRWGRFASAEDITNVTLFWQSELQQLCYGQTIRKRLPGWISDLFKNGSGAGIFHSTPAFLFFYNHRFAASTKGFFCALHETYNLYIVIAHLQHSMYYGGAVQKTSHRKNTDKPESSRVKEFYRWNPASCIADYFPPQGIFHSFRRGYNTSTDTRLKRFVVSRQRYERFPVSCYLPAFLPFLIKQW